MLKPLQVLKLYPEHDYSLAGALESRRASRGSMPFILDKQTSLTWDDFSAKSAKLAQLFVSRGVEHGDRIAVMARNHIGHVLTLFAAARIGAVMVPINPEFGVEETRYVLSHADVSGVISSAEVEPALAAAIQASGSCAWRMLLDDGVTDVPLMYTLIDKAKPLASPNRGAADDTCVIVYTSGTTGLPKGVMHSQRNFVLAGEAFVERVHLQPDDRVMIVLPLFHMNALFYSVAGSLVGGGSAFIISKFSASTFWETAAEYRVTQVNIIEAIGSILQSRPRSEFVLGHTIRAVYGVRANAANAFQQEFGIPELLSGFGMTEVPGVTCNPFGMPNKLGSMGVIGKHPDPDRSWARCRIVDDRGNDVPDGVEGELAVKTPILMQGYFRDPEQTAAAFRDGWFMTGDIVRRDADGFYFHVSRKNDIIRRRGENIAGAELDRVIGAHPAVLEVAAVAVPSELGEDEIMAVVVTRPDNRVEAADIARWCRERLAPQKVPRFVCFVNELPHTPTHKVAKETVRKDVSLRSRAVDLARLAIESRT